MNTPNNDPIHLGDTNKPENQTVETVKNEKAKTLQEVASEIGGFAVHIVKAEVATPLEEGEQIKKAREIMGNENFVGLPEIQIAFGFIPELTTIPEIPFSEEEIRQAKELSQILILRVDKASDGSPLTMKKIADILGNKVNDDKDLFWHKNGDMNWFENEDEAFYTSETAKVGWALVSKNEVPDSKDKDYLQQTEAIVNYLKNGVFAGVPLPKEYQKAIDEFESQKDEIAKLIPSYDKDDMKAASEKLSGLAITGLTRQTPVEAIYDLVVHFQNTNDRLLEAESTWTSRSCSSGSLVRVGYFEDDGLNVFSDYSGYGNAKLGVSFSRSV